MRQSASKLGNKIVGRAHLPVVSDSKTSKSARPTSHVENHPRQKLATFYPATTCEGTSRDYFN